MTALREAAQQALEALELGYDSVKAEAAQYHTAMAGFRPQRHAALDAKVEQLAAAITALRAALAQEQAEPDISRCPKCNGPADNGFDRSIPPNPYLCTQCMAEPVQEPVAWVASPDGRVIYDDISKDDCLLRVSGDFENDEQRLRYAQSIVDKLNAAPPKAEPVQEPVGQISPDWSIEKECIDGTCVYLNDIGKKLPVNTKLYTAPPRRTMVPLTEEEIDAEWHELDGEASALFKRVIRKFARAVEKASWEKNHGKA